MREDLPIEDAERGAGRWRTAVRLFRLHRHGAAAAFREALRIRPGYVKGWYNLGVALFETGRHEEAAVAFREVVRREPGHARARFNLGIAFLALGRERQAAGAFREATRIFPSYVGANFNLGLCLLRPEDREGASRQLTVLSFLDPSLAQRYAALLSRGGATAPSPRNRRSPRGYPPI